MNPFPNLTLGKLIILATFLLREFNGFFRKIYRGFGDQELFLGGAGKLFRRLELGAVEGYLLPVLHARYVGEPQAGF